MGIQMLKTIISDDFCVPHLPCQVLALPFTLPSPLTGAFEVVGRNGGSVTAVHRLTLPEVPVTG